MKINAVVVAAVAAVLSASVAPAFAADTIPGISTDSIVSQLGAVGTMVGGVGMAAIAVVMGIRAVGYIKSALGR